MILGDFNIDLLKFESHLDTDNFLNCLLSSHFLPHIVQPTRITDHSSTLIDNIFFNSLDYPCISGNIIYDLSDHLPNFLAINTYPHFPKGINIYRRDFRAFDQGALIEDFQLINWNNELPEVQDPNILFNSFYDKVIEIVDHHIPIKKIPKRELKFQRKPWITPALQKSINIKNKLYKKYMKSKSIYHFTKFKIYRNKINHLCKISKKQYYNNYFNTNIKDSKKVWDGIKEIVSINKKSKIIPNKVIVDDKVCEDSVTIANAFNKYFTEVGPILAGQIPCMDRVPGSYLPTPLQNSFFINPVTSCEIEQEISKLNAGKAVGPFSIPIKVLKKVKFLLSNPLEVI